MIVDNDNHHPTNSVNYILTFEDFYDFWNIWLCTYIKTSSKERGVAHRYAIFLCSLYVGSGAGSNYFNNSMTPLPSQKCYAIVAILRNRQYVAELCNKELIELFNSIVCVKAELRDLSTR